LPCWRRGSGRWPAAADNYSEPCRSFVTGEPQDHPRVIQEQLDGIKFNVLLPPGYTNSGRRYAVVYLLNSGLGDQDEYLTATDLIEFTAAVPQQQRAIVVLPFGGLFGFYSDLRDGSQRWERFLIRRLTPHIDRTYRTLARRSQRAVAGFSMGGFGAMSYAARDPDLFVAAGSFSGVLDPSAPPIVSFMSGFTGFIQPGLRSQRQSVRDLGGSGLRRDHLARPQSQQSFGERPVLQTSEGRRNG
jgi:S-formylglutathione hydrolase FrmB